ncbi:MAG: NupC/NupG family nucleoside CNT transporter [Verrucomicrobia bacterium]|nr:NupC/NupG family nucleoside CNT transporter [Verrucomicrobiota bacterium]MDA1068241.1 NupC/NupG family nucleoside CNT transporter [Verrucomicrobiota bacterium]
MNALISLLGMVVLIGIALLFSSNRKAIKLRTVSVAFGLQFCIGGVVLFWDKGKQALEAIAFGVQQVINYSQDGLDFLLGGLVSDKMFELFGGLGFIFAFRVLPVIIFFSSLIAVLYHLKIMQIVIKILGGALQKMLGTSRAESMSAAANIFVGQTEAPLVVRPYIANMTRSELFAIMCGGVASIAGSVLAGFANMGVELKYLIAACFMAAPGGLLFAKLLIPETETPNDAVLPSVSEDLPANVFDAAATGASSGLKLAANVGAMLLAFIALIALVNGMVGGVANWFGYPDLTLQIILGTVFAPLAWVIGVPWPEAFHAGSFIGQKIILNEFVAYGDFVQVQETLLPRTKVIVTFALCGFANLSSIAILLGGIGVMAPSRRQEIANLGLKAILAGSLSNFLSAAIAGFFIAFS